jgi:phage N-6-adenine-methyltransferase
MPGLRPNTGAAYKRGQSTQEYVTPDDFMAAVIKRFGQPDFDLAATAANSKAGAKYFGIEHDALDQSWVGVGQLLWLNPPFNLIAPWAEKCASESRAGAGKILFLTPASVGSNWYRDYVHQRAHVIFLNGRITFDPNHPDWGYPKDTMLACYGFKPGFEVWTWGQTA